MNAFIIFLCIVQCNCNVMTGNTIIVVVVVVVVIVRHYFKL